MARLPETGHWVRQKNSIIVVLDPSLAARSLPAETVEGEAILSWSAVLDQRIDIYAQKSLVRLSAGAPGGRADASEMLRAVKSGALGGIYKNDELAPAQLAGRLGIGWWQLLPAGEDAAFVVDPDQARPPIIIFRDAVRSIPTRLDPALRRAWASARAWFGRSPSLLSSCPIPAAAGAAEVAESEDVCGLFLASDPPDHDVDRWFIRQRDLHAGNDVSAYIFVRDAYLAMKEEIDKAQGPEHFIYLCAWDLGLFGSSASDMTIGTGKATLFRALLTAASQRGVTLRALLYLSQRPSFLGGFDNQRNVDFINSLPTGAAIHDGRYLNAGSHHQKLLIVLGRDGLVGFCGGGMDIHASRMNWHDVHCRISGPAALDLQTVFTERWLDHPLRTLLPQSKQGISLANRRTQKSGSISDKWVQIGRTYGDGTAHPGLPVPDPKPSGLPQSPLLLGSRAYAFAPNGEHTIHDMICNAISQSRRFIFFEDQYLVCSKDMGFGQSVSKMLADQISSLSVLVIMVAAVEQVEGEMKQVWRRRRDFLSRIRQADATGTKVIVARYKKRDASAPVGLEDPTFVHSKTWIFDDKFAIIGSANCTRRSYSHDSEVAAGIFDENPHGDRPYFAHELRIRIWAKHLGVPEADVVDPIASASLWLRPAHLQPKIELFNENDGADAGGPFATDLLWDKVLDPDGSGPFLAAGRMPIARPPPYGPL